MYLSQMSVYMGTWHQFETAMVAHFAARNAEAAKFGMGKPDSAATNLLQMQGEPESGGLGRYLDDRKKDKRVRDTWTLACERHELGVEEFLKSKSRIASEGFARA